MDEDEAVQKYNFKTEKKLQNSVFDKILRKDKNWSHANKMTYDIT